MANSLSEWVYSHRLTTRHEARKSSVRICFILAKQANRNANYFSAKQKLLWMSSLNKHVLFRSIHSKYFSQIDIFIKMTLLKQYFHYNICFSSQLFAHLGGFISLRLCSPPSPDGVFRTRQFRNKQGRTAVLPLLYMTQLIAKNIVLWWSRYSPDPGTVAWWAWRSVCPLASLKTRNMWPLFTPTLTPLLRQSWVLHLKGCSSCEFCA